MTRFGSFRLSPRRAAAFAGALAILSGFAPLSAAGADSAPFAGFPGRWSGTGVVHVKSDDGLTTERVRCRASYHLNGSHQVDLQLGCKSDNYNFDLTGNFEADARNQVTGRWSEESHNIGGTAIGRARGDRLQIHAESSAFSAELSMITKSSRQSVSLNSRAAGKRMTASITLHRN